MEIPKKKRRTEEEVDFKKCIICQRETSEPLVENASIDAYKNILFYVISRAKYGESEFVGATRTFAFFVKLTTKINLSTPYKLKTGERSFATLLKSVKTTCSKFI